MRIDSAGIEVVTGPSPIPMLPWKIADTPRVNIGVVEGAAPYVLTAVTGAFIDREGRIVIADAGALELRRYDASGAYTGSVGGKGAGPGEFRSIMWMRNGRADSVFVFHHSLRRISVFDPDLVFARSSKVEAVTPFDALIGPLDDGSYVVVEEGLILSLDLEEGTSRRTSTYSSLDSDGTVRDTLATFPSGTHTIIDTGTADIHEFNVIGTPFGRETFSDAADGGFIVADNDRFEIRYYDPAGRLFRIARLPASSKPVTRADRRAYHDALMTHRSPRSRSEVVEALWKAAEIPGTWPYFGGLTVDASGNAWLAEYTLPGQLPRQWTVFGPEGNLLGRVRAPTGFDVLWIGEQAIVVRNRDEDGVQSVSVYALQR